MPIYGDIWNQKKRFIPLVASLSTTANRMLKIVYSDYNSTDDMYMAIGLVLLRLSAVLKIDPWDLSSLADLCYTILI